MTTQESNSRDRRIVENIHSVIRVDPRLRQYATAVQISVENASVVLRGELPNSELKEQLIPLVRQAGVLYQITDQVRIAS